MNNKYLRLINALLVVIAVISYSSDRAYSQNVYGPGGIKLSSPSVQNAVPDMPSVKIRGKSGPASNPSTGGGGGGSGFVDILKGVAGAGCASGGGVSIGGGCTGLGAGPAYGKNGIYKNDTVDATSCSFLSITQGSFGAMALIIAGIVAICGAMMGSYRMALNTILVGGGAWAIYPLVTLFWGDILPCS
jgi:hypothetical protein